MRSIYYLTFGLILSSSLLIGAPLKNSSKSETVDSGKPSGKASLGNYKYYLDLAIFPSGVSASQNVNGEDLKFLDSCAEFAKLLINNRGLWGTGPFRRAKCYSSEAAIPKEINSWQLKIISEKDKKRFEISFVDRNYVSEVASEFTVDTEISPTILLLAKRSRAIIAANLSLGLPFSSIVEQDAIDQDGELVLPGLKIKNLPPPDSSLRVFYLVRKNRVWKSTEVAIAELGAEDVSMLKFKIKVENPDLLSQVRRESQSKIFFLQQFENKDAERERLAIALREEFAGFFQKFLRFARAAYLGFRYGRPLGRSNGVLTEASIVGVFGEFRAGVFQGIKFNYDLIPEQKAFVESTKQRFKWSRMQFGYGFGFNFSNSIFNWIDVTPKLGVTSLELDQGLSDLTGDPGYSFRLQKAPTVGLEIGIEKRAPYFLGRLWTYGSYSAGVLRIDKEYKSSIVRVGFDIYRDLFALGSVKFALLGFGAADSTTVSRVVTEADVANDPNTVKNLKYRSFYGGGGLTVTW